ncbi:hypothetical protein L1049_026629 [Liquidambar formosana]|uniref:Aminotransferase-like plant mobile domain-containing protein n=1 Tax=Liquidambar formosana TaxID=63359 RepID=A0AAP0NFW7_LIQFO
MNKLNARYTRKCDDNVIELIRFQIGSKVLMFESVDISVIFGIPIGQHGITFAAEGKPKSPFMNRRFGDVERISRTEIEKQIFLAANGTRVVNYEEVARFIMLHLCVTLLFTTKGRFLGWSYIQYIENLDRVTQYNWPDAIHSTLMLSIEKNINSLEKVNGCVILLLYWLCEWTNIIQPMCDDYLPQLVKWDLRELTEALNKQVIQNINFEKVLYLLRIVTCISQNEMWVSGAKSKNELGEEMHDPVQEEEEAEEEVEEGDEHTDPSHEMADLLHKEYEVKVEEEGLKEQDHDDEIREPIDQKAKEVGAEEEDITSKEE